MAFNFILPRPWSIDLHELFPLGPLSVTLKVPSFKVKCQCFAIRPYHL